MFTNKDIEIVVDFLDITHHPGLFFFCGVSEMTISVLIQEKILEQKILRRARQLKERCI
jgi:hypothetical protein